MHRPLFCIFTDCFIAREVFEAQIGGEKKEKQAIFFRFWRFLHLKIGLPLRRIVSRDHSPNSRLLRPLFICLEGCNRNTVVWLLQSTNISGANFGCDVLALSSAAHNLSPDEKNFEWVPNLGCHISLDCPIGIIS